MDGFQLAPEGLAAGDSVLDANGRLRKYEFKPGRARSLAELAGDYAFFTPAVLYLHGRFRDAPLADFVYTVAPDCKFYYKKFRRALFRGLDAPNGDVDWNFALWAVPRHHWDAFSAWMVGITLTYEDTREVAGIGEQILEVADPIAAELATVWHPGTPAVTVAAFGINGSRFRAGFVPGENVLMDPPRLEFFRPEGGMKVFADALYTGSNPLDARAYHRWRESLREEQGNED